MRLWLVRHGLTEWNTQQRFCGHSDIPLSAQGRVQARWLARRLQEETISTIHTSDLARARETAEMIAGHRTQPLQVRVSAAWREINFGDWKGLPTPRLQRNTQASWAFLPTPSIIHRRVVNLWRICCSAYVTRRFLTLLRGLPAQESPGHDDRTTR